jgi:single-strand DNA-binding protein
MPLPKVSGEFGIVKDPEVRFSEAGKCWVKVRGVAKKRVRDSNGTWADGDPLFIDIVVFGKQAEYLADSVKKGDSITVEGNLEQNEWDDKETGQKRQSMQIVADIVGVSTRWGVAKSQKVLEESGEMPPSAPADSADPWASADAPFDPPF